MQDFFYKPFFFDLDDCVFDTHGFFRDELSSKFGIHIPEGEYISIGNGGEEFDSMLDSAKFMLELDIRPGVIEVLRMLQSLEVPMGICTHRGYNEKGYDYTEQSLRSHKIRHFFTDLHVINPLRVPDKVAYLNQTIGEYRLLDDRPKYGAENSLPDNVILFTQKWNEHVDHKYRIDSFNMDHFFSVVKSMIRG